MGEGEPVASEYVLRVLEFDKILARLAGYVSWAGGREKVEELRPASDPEEVRSRLEETGEALALLEVEGFSLGGVKDVRRHVHRAQVGAALEPGELLEVAATLAGSRRLRRLLEENRERAPRLSRWAPVLADLPRLEREIVAAITPQGEVADAASPRLSRIRRSARLLQDRLRNQMEAYVRSPHFLRHLQEPIVTVRDGRYVLPVKASARAQVPGIIHDQSASGATLFVEPLATVELNNELRRLALEEKEEVARILGRLSAAVGKEAAAILAASEALAWLDLALAKARYARDLSATCPRLDTEGRLRLREARHPLLGKAAVPIDVELGEEFDTLVISGPNTGGKTVALKTVGLLTLMAQAGLRIPGAAGSQVAVFRKVFADIGDEQSIEQSLSTFSSHLRNIVTTVREAGPGTLVLLDELGAGTDPAQGAALGMAILEFLQGRGCRTVVTTHAGELKAFAYSHPRVESAAVEFDPATLEPTYRLRIGAPGFSNAFAIAARLGLPEEIVARARSLLSPDQQRVEALLAGLAADRQQAAEERALAARSRREAEEARQASLQKWEELRAREEALLARVQQKAREMLDQLRFEARAVAETLRRAEREEDRRLRQAALEEAREKIRRWQARVEALPREGESPRIEPPEVASPQVEPHQLEPRQQVTAPSPETARPGAERLLPGARVRIVSLGREGHLLSPPDPEGGVEVQVGLLRARVPLADLVIVEEAGSREAVRWAFRKTREVSPELHVRGLTVEDACQAVSKYLDDAVLAGMRSVRIVHGKGTGALRRAVADLLASHPQVESFRLADLAEGGEGATVVVLKT